MSTFVSGSGSEVKKCYQPVNVYHIYGDASTAIHTIIECEEGDILLIGGDTTYEPWSIMTKLSDKEDSYFWVGTDFFRQWYAPILEVVDPLISMGNISVPQTGGTPYATYYGVKHVYIAKKCTLDLSLVNSGYDKVFDIMVLRNTKYDNVADIPSMRNYQTATYTTSTTIQNVPAGYYRVMYSTVANMPNDRYLSNSKVTNKYYFGITPYATNYIATSLPFGIMIATQNYDLHPYAVVKHGDALRLNISSGSYNIQYKDYPILDGGE